MVRSRAQDLHSSLGFIGKNNSELQVGQRLILVLVLAAGDATGTAGSDKADLLARDGVPLDGGGVADVLVVTPTVGVLDGVHSNTTDGRPAVALDLYRGEKGVSF